MIRKSFSFKIEQTEQEMEDYEEGCPTTARKVLRNTIIQKDSDQDEPSIMNNTVNISVDGPSVHYNMANIEHDHLQLRKDNEINTIQYNSNENFISSIQEIMPGIVKCNRNFKSDNYDTNQIWKVKNSSEGPESRNSQI